MMSLLMLTCHSLHQPIKAAQTIISFWCNNGPISFICSYPEEQTNTVYKLYCSDLIFIMLILVWSLIQQTPAVNLVYSIYSFNSFTGIYRAMFKGLHIHCIILITYMLPTCLKSTVLYTFRANEQYCDNKALYTRIANVMAIYKYHPDHAEYDRVSREIVKNILFWRVP